VNEIIDHEFLRHPMLHCRVVAARAVAYVSVLKTAMVVPRHNLVKDAISIKTRGKRVVVHDILHNAQAHAVQSLQEDSE
jgi:hypothetical protein